EKIMHLLFLKGPRNELCSRTVSARALIIRAPMDMSFAQNGTSPHRARTRDGTGVLSTARMFWAGALLYLGRNPDITSLSISRSDIMSLIFSGLAIWMKRPHI